VAAITREGKATLATERIVLATAVIDGDLPNDPKGVIATVSDYFGLQPSLAAATDAVSRLLKANSLSLSPSDRLVPSPEAKTSLERRAAEAAELEHAVKEAWLIDVRSELPTNTIPDGQLWNALERLLSSIFNHHGVETIRLLQPPGTGGPDLGGMNAWIREAARAAGVGDDSELRIALGLFFNRSSPEKTRYLAELLDSTFTFFALTVDDATAQYLTGTLPPTRVFLDTNFIFGILGLHDNPLNQVSRELLEVIKHQKIPFRLYYHERTLKEIDATVFAVGQRLKARQWRSTLSHAAVQTGSLSGIELHYHRLNAVRSVDPEIFMSKYEKIPLLLAESGVEIYREEQSESLARERWLLTADFIEQVKIWRPGRPRPYEAADHDASLLQASRGSRRPERPTMSSGSFILTVDYLLQRFDRHLSRKLGVSPSVVMPVELMQLLRPFVPATEEFDQRFVEALALPEFRSLASDYSSTASKVLSYLATYEDLPAETAIRLLRDEILLESVRTTPEKAPAFAETIDSAIAAANLELAATNAALVKALAEQASDFSKREAERDRVLAEQEARLKQEPVSPPVAQQQLDDIGPPRQDQDRQRNVWVDVRIPAAALVAMLIAATWGCWFLLGPLKGQDATTTIAQSLAVALVGGIGAILSVLALVIGWRGVVKGHPDYVSGSVTNKVILGTVTLAAGAFLATVWSLR
jgi:hypothetical protein